jgi:hypothetical protein
MFGLAPETDLSFLRGVELLQVCIGANEVILAFHPNVTITIEGTFQVEVPGSTAEVFDDARSSAASLVTLLEGTVKSVAWEESGTVRLDFTSGAALEIYDSQEHYESFQITHGAAIYVI